MWLVWCFWWVEHGHRTRSYKNCRWWNTKSTFFETTLKDQVRIILNSILWDKHGLWGKRQNKQSNNIIHCILKQASLRHFSAVIFWVPEIMNNYIETCTSQKVIDNSIQNFSVLSETLIFYQYFLNIRKKQLNSLLSNGLTTGAKAIEFIISILKSLVIPVIWFALSSVIYSRITLFVLNHLFSKLHHSCSKSHHFCFKSHQFLLYFLDQFLLYQFCFRYKMRFKSLFVSAFQQNSYLFK